MSCLFDTDFGTQIFLGDDASQLVLFSQGFKFSFYGITHNDVFVNANGNLTFGAPSSDYNPTFNVFEFGPPRIAPYWTDLMPPFGGGVFVKQLPDRFIVTWYNIPYFFIGFPPINTFQIVLCSNGLISFGYDTLDNNNRPVSTNTILIGVASGFGGSSSIFSYNPPLNFDPQQTVEGPQGILDNTQLFWIYNGSEYILIDRVVPFCCTVVVPSGFIVDRNMPPVAGLSTHGMDCLNCVLEPFTVTASIPDPCSCECGNHVCLVEVNALRAIGCISVNAAVPIRSESNSTTSYVCSSCNVCFNKILCLECKDASNPCTTEFLANATIQNIALSRLVATVCNGDEIYQLTGLIKLLPCC